MLEMETIIVLYFESRNSIRRCAIYGERRQPKLVVRRRAASRFAAHKLAGVSTSLMLLSIIFHTLACCATYIEIDMMGIASEGNPIVSMLEENLGGLGAFAVSYSLIASGYLVNIRFSRTYPSVMRVMLLAILGISLFDCMHDWSLILLS